MSWNQNDDKTKLEKDFLTYTEPSFWHVFLVGLVLGFAIGISL